MLKNNSYMKAYLNTIKESVINKASVKKYQSIAKEIGGEYILETNTIDCKGNKVEFKNDWINEDGSFDFKLITISNDWSFMFSECSNLTHLPEDFIIPQHVVDTNRMFYNCISLTHLPEHFTIPQSVVNINRMFFRCVCLKHLPKSLLIPNGVEDCSFMFARCYDLIDLPENFTIPNTVQYCINMFYNCISLKELPIGFNIPSEAKCEHIFLNCDQLKNNNSDTYKMLEI